MDSRQRRSVSLNNGGLGGMAISVPQQRTGTVFTMSGKGGHVLMNSHSIITATNVQFLPPARPKCISAMAGNNKLPVSTLNPVLNTIRGFFSLLFWPIFRPHPDNDPEVQQKCKPQFAVSSPIENHPHPTRSAAHTNSSIYMNFMSDFSSFSFFEYDEYGSDRMDSPVDLKQFDCNEKMEATASKMEEEEEPEECILSDLKAKMIDELSLGALSIDTTDFFCSFSMPQHALVEYPSMPMNVAVMAEKTESGPCELNTDILPPAVGQWRGAMIEDSRNDSSTTPKPPHSDNSNQLEANRRMARMNGRRGNKQGSKKAPYSCKNRTSKFRHEMELSIQANLDDMLWAADELEDDDGQVINEEREVNMSSSSSSTPIVIEESRPGCIFSHFFSFEPCNQWDACKSWPMTATKPANQQGRSVAPSLRRPRISESESDDSFINFAEDSPRRLSSATAVKTQNAASPCRNTALNMSVASCIAPTAVTRERRLSECSDDFIFFEDDGNTIGDNDDADDYGDIEDSDNDSDSETEAESMDEVVADDSDLDTDDEYWSTGTNPPDSGIEEKKVGLNYFISLSFQVEQPSDFEL